MIDNTKIIKTVHERLKNLPTGHYLDLQTYKRNRSIIIAKLDEDDLLVIENGHFKERFRLRSEKLKKLLKTPVRKEFPRSRKIRGYTLWTVLPKKKPWSPNEKFSDILPPTISQ